MRPFRAKRGEPNGAERFMFGAIKGIVPMSFPTLYSFSGRIGRREFVLTLIGVFTTTYFLTFLLIVVGGAGYASNAGIRGLWALIIDLMGGLGAVHALWIALAAAVKRCHDRALSGWMLLFAMPPVIGQIWLVLSLFLTHGDPRPNAFGPAPATGGLSHRPAVA